MARGNYIGPIKLFEAADATVQQTSVVIDAKRMRLVSVQLVSDTASSGTLTLESSVDYDPQNPAAATWQSDPNAGGSLSDLSAGTRASINSYSFPYMRYVYDPGVGAAGTFDLLVFLQGFGS